MHLKLFKMTPLQIKFYDCFILSFFPDNDDPASVSLPHIDVAFHPETVSLYPTVSVGGRTRGIKKKSEFLKKGLSIFAMLSVTCGFLFLRFQAELPIQIILSMLFKHHVLTL